MDGNSDGSFGAPYYRSADYRMRYPAYLRPVAPPPVIVKVHSALYPKQFAVRKTDGRPEKNGRRFVSDGDRPVGGDATAKRMAGRKKRPRRLRRNNSASPPGDGNRAAAVTPLDDGDDQIQDLPCPVYAAVPDTPADNNQARSSRHSLRTTSVHSRPPSAGLLPQDDGNPQNPRPFSPSSDYYLPAPSFPPPAPPPPPPTAHVHRKSAGSDDGDGGTDTTDPLERFRRTAKRFEKECRRRRQANAVREELAQAKSFAEQAKDVAVVLAAKRDRSYDARSRRKARDAAGEDADVVQRDRRLNGGSEYAELERLGLGKCDDSGRWVPNSRNRLKDRLVCFQ